MTKVTKLACLTYLDVDVLKIFALVSVHHVVHAVRVDLVADHGHLLLRHVHTHMRLDFGDDPDLLCRVMFTIKGGALGIQRCREVSFLACALLTATVAHSFLSVCVLKCLVSAGRLSHKSSAEW